jgi:carbonic anhydrase
LDIVSRKSMDHLFEQNREWAAARVAEDPAYFRRLANLQSPEYFWIGCSDSRVPANVITGLQPGEVFVHRNVANLVNPGDLNCLAVLQFAVDVLRVKHVIVCGHYGCGGVHAALTGQRHGLIDHWLHPIRDLACTHVTELDALPDMPARHNRLCEINVIEAVRLVADTPIMRDAWARGAEVSVHGWVYSLEDGLIRDMQCTRSSHLGGGG